MISEDNTLKKIDLLGLLRTGVLTKVVRQVSGFEVYKLINELRVLEGSWLDKVFLLNNTLIFRFRVSSDDNNKNSGMIKSKLNKIVGVDEKKVTLVFLIPRLLFLKPGFLRMSKELSMGLNNSSGVLRPDLLGLIRKKLNGLRLLSVEQVGFDRIIKLSFGRSREDSKELYYSLIIELFDKGNVVLVDSNNNILGLLNDGNRGLRVKTLYKKPDFVVENPFLMGKEGFVNGVKEFGLVKFLASKLGFGRVYAEEICFRMGFVNKEDKNKKVLKEEELVKLLSIINELKGCDKGFLYLIKKSIDNDIDNIVNSIEYSSCPLKRLKGVKGEKSVKEFVFESFNQALLGYINYVSNKSKSLTEETNLEDKELRRLEKVIKIQEERLLGLKQEEEENKRIGNWFYENYNFVNELIKNVSSLIKELKNKGLKDSKIRKVLKQEFNIIEDIDFKEKSFIIRLEKKGDKKDNESNRQ